MRRSWLSVRRIVALSVALTLFAAPIASAQSPEGAPSIAAPANTPLLSPAAFARLIQSSPTDVTPAPVAADSLRPSLLRQATAAMAREARTAAKTPQQRNWASRNKGALIWAIVAGVIASSLIWLALCDGCGE